MLQLCGGTVVSSSTGKHSAVKSGSSSTYSLVDGISQLCICCTSLIKCWFRSVYLVATGGICVLAIQNLIFPCVLVA